VIRVDSQVETHFDISSLDKYQQVFHKQIISHTQIIHLSYYICGLKFGFALYIALIGKLGI